MSVWSSQNEIFHLKNVLWSICLVLSSHLSFSVLCVLLCNATWNSFLCKEAMLVLYYSHTSQLTQRETPCLSCLLLVSLSLSLGKVKEWGHVEFEWQRQHKNPHCLKCSHLYPLIFSTSLMCLTSLSCQVFIFLVFHPKPLIFFSPYPYYLILLPFLQLPLDIHHSPPLRKKIAVPPTIGLHICSIKYIFTLVAVIEMLFACKWRHVQSWNKTSGQALSLS